MGIQPTYTLRQIVLTMTAVERHNSLDVRTILGLGEMIAYRVYAFTDQAGSILEVFVKGRLVTAGRSVPAGIRVRLSTALRSQCVTCAADLFQTDWVDSSITLLLKNQPPILADRRRRAV